MKFFRRTAAGHTLFLTTRGILEKLTVEPNSKLILSCLFMYCSFASTGRADIIWSIVSSNCWQSLHLLSVSVFSIFVAWHFVYNSWSCAPTTSLSFSAFNSPFESRRNVSSLLISLLLLLLLLLRNFICKWIYISKCR